MTVKKIKHHNIRFPNVCTKLFQDRIMHLRMSLVSSSNKVGERGQWGCNLWGRQDIGNAEWLFVGFMTHWIARGGLFFFGADGPCGFSMTRPQY